MIYNKQVECLSFGSLQDLQSQRLSKIVNYIFNNSEVAQKKLAQARVDCRHIKTIGDIVHLPFTVKDDLRENYPFGLFSSPMNDIREVHISSGTTGNPIVVGYAKEDIDLWADVIARSLCCAGVLPGDMIQIAYGYGLFTGGLGLHYGSQLLGLTVIPCSSGQTNRQLKIMQDFKPKVLACTPSYAIYMAETALELGIDPKQSSWKIGIFGAEPWSEAMRQEIEKRWAMEAIDIYGLSEIIGPGVACECHCKNGLHVPSDVFYPEVIDPKTLKRVESGTPGELVVTTLTKVGMPLIRYRTRDIVTINDEPCACGRTSPRISKVLGRTDDMIVVRGINVFPTQIEEVLLKINGTEPHYQIIVDRQKGMDQLEILVELGESSFSDEVKKLQSFEQRIAKAIESVLSIGVKVRLVEPKSLERSEGKSKRIIDKRSL